MSVVPVSMPEEKLSYSERVFDLQKRIEEVEANERIRDAQVQGPFSPEQVKARREKYEWIARIKRDNLKRVREVVREERIIKKKEARIAQLKREIKRMREAKALKKTLSSFYDNNNAAITVRDDCTKLHQIALRVLQTKTDALEASISALESRVHAIAALRLAVETLMAVNVGLSVLVPSVHVSYMY